jgi:hypothetical protein
MKVSGEVEKGELEVFAILYSPTSQDEEQTAMIRCPFCRFENEDGALFCEQCKSDLGAAQPVSVGQEAVASERGHDDRPGETLPLAAEPIEQPENLETVAEAVPVAEIARPELTPDVATYGESAPPVAEAVPAADSVPPSATDEVAGPVTEPASVLRAASIPGLTQPANESQMTPGGKPKLVVLRGQRINAEYPLYEGENYVGRADEKAVDIDLEDQEPPDRVWSSRQHALIVVDNGAMTIEDLNSLNGTYVNRTRVHPGQKRPLNLEDVIQIGTVQMKVKA